MSVTSSQALLTSGFFVSASDDETGKSLRGGWHEVHLFAFKQVMTL